MTKRPAAKAAPPTRFVLHRNAQGYWMASERNGYVTGIFAIRSDALSFVRSRLNRAAGFRHSPQRQARGQ